MLFCTPALPSSTPPAFFCRNLFEQGYEAGLEIMRLADIREEEEGGEPGNGDGNNNGGGGGTAGYGGSAIGDGGGGGGGGRGGSSSALLSAAQAGFISKAPPPVVMAEQDTGGGGGGGQGHLSSSSSALPQSSSPPLTTKGLAAAWDRSAARARHDDGGKVVAPPLSLDSAFAKRQYGSRYPRSFWAHLWALTRRQTTITLRNTLFIRYRIASACILALILGSVWWQLDKTMGPQLFGLLLFATNIVAFANLSEVPFAVEFKYVAYKHMGSSMFPTSAYVIAASLVHAPIAAVETLAYSTILFFMTGLDPGEAGESVPGGRWAFFWLVLFLVDIGMGSVFRHADSRGLQKAAAARQHMVIPCLPPILRWWQ